MPQRLEFLLQVPTDTENIVNDTFGQLNVLAMSNSTSNKVTLNFGAKLTGTSQNLTVVTDKAGICGNISSF